MRHVGKLNLPILICSQPCIHFLFSTGMARWLLTFSTIIWQIALFTFDILAMHAWLANLWSWGHNQQKEQCKIITLLTNLTNLNSILLWILLLALWRVLESWLIKLAIFGTSLMIFLYVLILRSFSNCWLKHYLKRIYLIKYQKNYLASLLVSSTGSSSNPEIWELFWDKRPMMNTSCKWSHRFTRYGIIFSVWK
jgi:hypothetical protein